MISLELNSKMLKKIKKILSKKRKTIKVSNKYDFSNNAKKTTVKHRDKNNPTEGEIYD